ncbi:hypothetical protein M0802_010838 [Mischocyttarus mexicanus]|nr:hypothetical protein M0802_010838 [Mischocyttarus mexicanus]
MRDDDTPVLMHRLHLSEEVEEEEEEVAAAALAACNVTGQRGWTGTEQQPKHSAASLHHHPSLTQICQGKYYLLAFSLACCARADRD